MGRSPCCEKAHINKGAWTREEDQRLISYIQAHGECWRSLPKAAELLRCSSKSCRLLWINYLRPDLKRGNFTEDEDELIIKLYSLLGNKKLTGRTDNEIKNYWNTHIRRKLISRGIDPCTHKPFSDVCAATTKSSSSTAPALPFPAEDQKNCSSTESVVIVQKNRNSAVAENCSELNLELRMSPPQGHDHKNPYGLVWIAETGN